MKERFAVTIDAGRWRVLRDSALAIATTAKLFANVAFGLATVVSAALGLRAVDAEWKYSVLIYAPVVGLLARAVVEQATVASRSSRVTRSMRELLVPDVVERIDDSQLLVLARWGGVVVGGQTIRVG